MQKCSVIGAGLAGCEAAWQLSKRGVQVILHEMKPEKKTPAHCSSTFAELVCSNSLRSDRLQNAVGLLKEEMRRLDSLVMQAADATRVPAGGALAVDRDGFSRYITDAISNNPHIAIKHGEVTHMPEAPAIIATGPLTAGPLFEEIENKLGTSMHFYDAAAPIVYRDSLNMDIVFCASRYERGSDYLNCPLTREEYFQFYSALIQAESVKLREYETPRVFEGCMPVEIMAKRGEMTLAFGPLKPVGLSDPRWGNSSFSGGERREARPFAVVQLRQDDAAGQLYNMVGFQTNLKFSEQQRVFRMIPGMEHAEFARYGVMHRNSYLHSPGILDECYGVKTVSGLYFAGQITGVEGYVESAASGLLSGISMAKRLHGEPMPDFTRCTALGALGHYVANYQGTDFQPMNITYGILEPLSAWVKNKQQRYEQMAVRALEIVEKLKPGC